MKIILLLFFIFDSFFVVGQNCTGDACSSIVLVTKPSNFGGGIPNYQYIFTNNSKRRVKLSVKSQIMWSGCSDFTTKDLSLGESLILEQPNCIPYSAVFIDPLPVTPKSQQPSTPITSIKTSPPMIEEGNYRIRNALTDQYLILVIDSVIKGTTTLVCDSVNKKNWEVAKWKIKNIPICLSDSAGTVHKDNYNLRSKVSGFSVGRFSCKDTSDCAFYAIYASQYEQYIATPDYYNITWQFVKKKDENTYQIKTLNHFFYLDNVKSIVSCHEILGEPKSSLWILEPCE